MLRDQRNRSSPDIASPGKSSLISFQNCCCIPDLIRFSILVQVEIFFPTWFLKEVPSDISLTDHNIRNLILTVSVKSKIFINSISEPETLAVCVPDCCELVFFIGNSIKHLPHFCCFRHQFQDIAFIFHCDSILTRLDFLHIVGILM